MQRRCTSQEAILRSLQEAGGTAGKQARLMERTKTLTATLSLYRRVRSDDLRRNERAVAVEHDGVRPARVA